MHKFRLTKDEKKAIPFLLPGLMVTALLILYPLFYVVTMSFQENGVGESGFAGFKNYTKLFRNPQFSQTVTNTLVWTIATVLLSFLIGFCLAMLINRSTIRGKGMWRGLIFIAWIIPGVVKATAWKWLFTTDGGMANHLLQALHIIKEPIPWLTSPKYAMLSIIIVQIWACAPYVMLMMTAGLQQMPKELYESADMDGASWWRKIISITLPMLKDISFICLLMLLVWAINEFSLIWIMTSGGMGTTTLSLMVYNQFKVLNLNGASASAVMQLVVTLIFALIYVKTVIKEEA
ncbi:MAG: sugar ABC transporter permease [Pygmaiobacter massiliensis]|nr:sugar ABC transporter permease [Pygmaiobacter massiliensis]